MPGSHWLLSLTPANFQVMRATGFSLLGVRTRHRRKAERMAPGDRVLYYVLEDRTFPASVTVTSGYFEERTHIWENEERRDDPFPYRVHTQPNLVLEPWEGLDAAAIAPRLQYLKRWAPEHWHLALLGDVHLLSAQDFQFVETEIQRTVEGRASRAEVPPRSRGRE